MHRITNIKILLKLFFLILVLSGCMVQFSSLKKMKESDVPSANMGVIKYYSVYKMNMGKSEDIIIIFKNNNSGQEYNPNTRSQDGMTVVSVPEGEYVLSKLIIRETEFTKCLCKVDGADKYVYGFSDKNCNSLNRIGLIGTPLNGGLLLDEKYLMVEDKIINAFQIKSGQVYVADTLLIQGRMESLFKDLPNIEIRQSTSKNSPNEINFFSKNLIEINRKKSENK